MMITHNPRMPPALRDFAVDIVQRLRLAGFEAYFAGGCVRDLLLQRSAKDYDVATSARPEQVREIFGPRKTLAVGESFGVIVVLGPRNIGQVEVATFRTDLEYLDGRRPTGVRFSSAEEDALRRDFTINGMFYDPVEGRILDFVGGEADLARGVIRAIGEPAARMREDKLRMLRAVRFAATLEFALDPATAAAVADMASQLTVVSAERIAMELRRMLTDRHRTRALTLCHELGLLAVCLPELLPLWDDGSDPPVECRMLSLLETPSFELALAALLHRLEPAVVEGIGKRWKLSNAEIDQTTWLVMRQGALLEADRLTAAQLKRTLAHPYRDALLALTHAWLLATGRELHPVLFAEEYLRRTPPEVLDPPPLVTGRELIQLGLAPGPRFKEWLEQARDAQLNGEVTTSAEAVAYIQRLQGLPSTGTP